VSGHSYPWWAYTGPSDHPLPPVPSRDQVCGVNLTFQGLIVETQQFGVLPWFEAALSALTAEDRQAVYAAKHAAGDTHCLVVPLPAGPVYDEPGNPYQAMIAPDLLSNPSGYADLVTEVIRAGFTPICVLNGDDDGSHGVNIIPVVEAELVSLSGALGTLNAYCLWVLFWDGVFYGWEPDLIARFGVFSKTLVPYIGIEHQPGRIPVGNGPSDYTPGGLMAAYDVLFSEFDNGLPHSGAPNPSGGFIGDEIWQVYNRYLGPAYVKPADQLYPAGAPWYLNPAQTARQVFACAFEWGAYDWVRCGWGIRSDQAAYLAALRALSAVNVQNRQYLRALGCQFVG
jgi:hypothetical protein